MLADTDGTPEEITTFVGRGVYSSNDVLVGEAEDIRLDLDHETVAGLALTALNDELFRNQIKPGEGVLIPYRQVRAVGDVILVNDVIGRLKGPEEDGESLVARRSSSRFRSRYPRYPSHGRTHALLPLR